MTIDDLVDVCHQIRANATEVDLSVTPPKGQLELLAQAGYFATTARADAAERRRLLDHLSSACGTTAFLASQHEASCRRLLQAGHPLYPAAETGREWIGICFAHLRRSPSPVRVAECGEELVYSGLGPWFSGVGLMEKLLLAGATSEERFLMALVGLDVPGVSVGTPPRLAVMNATATATLGLQEVTVRRSEVVLENDASSMNHADMHATVMQSARSLGVARACAVFLPDSARQALLDHLERQHQKMDRWELEPTWTTATTLRLQALSLAGSAVGAALVTVGGRAHAIDHPVGRLAREASFYATTQTTRELREAMVANLAIGDRLGNVDSY